MLNRKILFKQENPNRYSVTVEYTERLGFQFKYCVKYRNYDVNEVKQLLEKVAKIYSASPDEEGLAWFLLREYKKHRTLTGEVNNYRSLPI